MMFIKSLETFNISFTYLLELGLQNTVIADKVLQRRFEDDKIMIKVLLKIYNCTYYSIYPLKLGLPLLRMPDYSSR